MKKIFKILIPILILLAALSVASHADEAYPVTVNSVLPNKANDKVTVTVSASAEFYEEHADGDVYLMELKAWNGAVLPADAKPVAQTKLKSESVSFSCGLDTATDRYDSFVIAVKDGAGYFAVSLPHFVDDPSCFSARSAAYPEYATKKGLVSDDIADLVLTGSAQTVIRIRADELLLPGYAEGSEAFAFCGNTYYVDRAALERLDSQVRALTGADINVFAQVTLSGKYRGGDSKLASLYYTDSPDGASAYALNTSSDSATTAFTAFMDFIAARYGVPGGDAFIGSWIVGGPADVASSSARGGITDEQYVESYQRVLRITDIAVRSVWKNARVYVPVSNDWNSRTGGPGDIGAKNFLTVLAANVKKHGDLPWRAAVSACPSDRTLAAVWTDAQATDAEDTKYVTAKNLGVLGSFLEKEEIAYDGSPRGYAVTDFAVNGSPDSPGDMTPAASFAYAYFKVAFDGRADALIWSSARDESYPEPEIPVSSSITGEDDGSGGETDGGTEDAPGSEDLPGSGEAASVPAEPVRLYLGIFNADGSKKPVCDVFTRIDATLPADPNAKDGDAVSFALSIIGIPDWTNAVPGYDKSAAVRYSLVESMPIMASDVSGKVQATSSFGFETGTGNFYTAGARYIELRTVEGAYGGKTAVLCAGLPDGCGSARLGVACPMDMEPSDAKYVSFLIYTEAPTDVASVAVSVALTGSGTEKSPSLFVGNATVKPNSWQEVTFRCDDLAGVSDRLDTLSVFVSSYDGLDHEGRWNVMIDDLVTYGAKSSRLLSTLVKLLVAALVILVVFVAGVFILRLRNRRLAKKAKRQRRAQQAPARQAKRQEPPRQAPARPEKRPEPPRQG